MKRVLITLGILSFLCLCMEIVQAITVGVEPPAQYMNNLKTCTKGTFTVNNSLIEEYIIKGKSPSGRCEVSIKSYTNFANPQVYENYKTILKGFAGIAKENINNSDIPTQQQIIEKAKKKTDITVCKLSDSERQELYNAYLKHDNQNPPAEITQNQISMSFSTEKMSTYDKLMMNMGSCISYDTNSPSGQNYKKYACEYADTTCYYTDMGSGVSMIKCSKESSSGISFEFTNKIKQHVKSGMCERIF